MASPATAYSRVGVPDGGPDNPRLYPLLASFVRDSTLAPRVTELVLDFERSRSRNPPEESPNLDHITLSDVPEGDAVYPALRRRVLNLGMDEARTATMARALQWRATAAPDAGGETIDEGCYHLLTNDGSRFEAQWQLTAAVLLLSMCDNIETLYLGPISDGSLLLREYLLRSNYGLLPR